MSVSIQAVWFNASLYTREQASDWCVEHDFKNDTYRTREEDGVITHHIFPQFDPSEGKDGTFAVLSDDFPDGITVTTCEVEGKAMDLVYTKGTQSADDPLEFVMSDETVDRVGDVIVAKGWNLEDFMKNPIALFGHSHRDIIGKWEDVRIQGKRLIGRLKLARQGTSPEIDTIRSLVEQRILKSVSVGFRPMEFEPIKDQKGNPTGGYKFLKSALHECSLVAVPCNPNALATAKSFGCSMSQLKHLFPDQAGEANAPMTSEWLEKQRQTGLALAKLNRSLQHISEKTQ